MLEGIADVTLPSIAAADTMWTPGLAPAAAAGSQTLFASAWKNDAIATSQKGVGGFLDWRDGMG